MSDDIQIAEGLREAARLLQRRRINRRFMQRVRENNPGYYVRELERQAESWALRGAIKRLAQHGFKDAAGAD